MTRARVFFSFHSNSDPTRRRASDHRSPADDSSACALRLIVCLPKTFARAAPPAPPPTLSANAAAPSSPAARSSPPRLLNARRRPRRAFVHRLSSTPLRCASRRFANRRSAALASSAPAADTRALGSSDAASEPSGGGPLARVPPEGVDLFPAANPGGRPGNAGARDDDDDAAPGPAGGARRKRVGVRPVPVRPPRHLARPPPGEPHRADRAGGDGPLERDALQPAARALDGVAVPREPAFLGRGWGSSKLGLTRVDGAAGKVVLLPERRRPEVQVRARRGRRRVPGTEGAPSSRRASRRRGRRRARRSRGGRARGFDSTRSGSAPGTMRRGGVEIRSGAAPGSNSGPAGEPSVGANPASAAASSSASGGPGVIAAAAAAAAAAASGSARVAAPPGPAGLTRARRRSELSDRSLSEPARRPATPAGRATFAARTAAGSPPGVPTAPRRRRRRERAALPRASARAGVCTPLASRTRRRSRRTMGEILPPPPPPDLPPPRPPSRPPAPRTRRTRGSNPAASDANASSKSSSDAETAYPPRRNPPPRPEEPGAGPRAPAAFSRSFCILNCSNSSSNATVGWPFFAALGGGRRIFPVPFGLFHSGAFAGFHPLECARFTASTLRRPRSPGFSLSGAGRNGTSRLGLCVAGGSASIRRASATSSRSCASGAGSDAPPSNRPGEFGGANRTGPIPAPGASALRRRSRSGGGGSGTRRSLRNRRGRGRGGCRARRGGRRSARGRARRAPRAPRPGAWTCAASSSPASGARAGGGEGGFDGGKGRSAVDGAGVASRGELGGFQTKRATSGDARRAAHLHLLRGQPELPDVPAREVPSGALVVEHDPAPRRRRAGAGEGRRPRPAWPHAPHAVSLHAHAWSTVDPGPPGEASRAEASPGATAATGTSPRLWTREDARERARSGARRSECRERAEAEGVVARVVDAAKRATSAASSSDCARGRTPSLRLKIRPARERRASRCTVTSVCKSGVSGDPRGSRARSRHSRARQGATRRERVLGGRASHLAVERLDRATPPLSSHPRDSRPVSPLG